MRLDSFFDALRVSLVPAIHKDSIAVHHIHVSLDTEMILVRYPGDTVARPESLSGGYMDKWTRLQRCNLCGGILCRTELLRPIPLRFGAKFGRSKPAALSGDLYSAGFLRA